MVVRQAIQKHHFAYDYDTVNLHYFEDSGKLITSVSAVQDCLIY